ncbi:MULTISPECIES: efflux RND transporter periplasmic adaptor subunit [Shewanella]|uniref:efflux RND transporter periplasmic adaptor subunit n=1 Tax=Shewanella TaxID=22 RepID=UPI0011840424|nr:MULTISPECIES: efflux RND transporter periplasmic adaptor subunit [Shewanella]QYJ90477.1 efflux RND transporter periplasmic adaptor subunit [Shewanella halotolerans]TVP15690.1 efflux transporter periplasmic adaptor subunit [Shewanella sp. KCT]
MKPLTTSLSLLVLTLVLAGCSTESAEIAPESVRPVKLLEITELGSGTLRSFPAKVAATKQAELSFRLSGQLVEFSLVDGQRVTKGEVLARLDDRDARNQLLNREADHELAQADFNRKGELLRQALISQAEYDLAKAQLKSSAANLASAQDQLSYTVIKAPFSGTVAKTKIENFQIVQANQPVLVLQKDRFIDVVIQVPESLASRVTSFNPHSPSLPMVTFSNHPEQKYAARLKEFATQVTPGTQSYEVVFTLPTPTEFSVLPGMSAQLILDIAGPDADKKSAIVPPSAVLKRDQDGEQIVWTYDLGTGQVSARKVSLGKVTSQGIEITQGLAVGDRVVVAGVAQLHENQQVKPLRWQRGV